MISTDRGTVISFREDLAKADTPIVFRREQAGKEICSSFDPEKHFASRRITDAGTSISLRADPKKAALLIARTTPAGENPTIVSE
jgi:hypothetical protein